MAAMRPISEICRRYRINRSTIHKYTKQYRKTGNIDPLSRKHIRDSMLLETIVRSKGSTSLKEMKLELSNFGDCVTMFRISRRCPSGTSTPKFWKSCSRQNFIVTLDENPHLRKAEAYFNRSGSISSKKSSISILSAILVKRARTPFKLQMFGSPTCHVCTQLEHIFLSCVHA